MSAELAFGTALRRLRTDAGLSLAGLATRAHYSKGYLSKLENGERRPTPEIARRCDAVLGADGMLSALVPLEPSGNSPPAPDTGGDIWVLALGEADGWFTLMSATQARTWSGPAPTALELGGNGNLADDPAVQSALEATFGHLRALGRGVNPSAVLPMVIAHTHSAIRLAGMSPAGPTIPPTPRAKLTAVAARSAEFAGWMAQEGGDERAALWWTRQAVRLAESGGDQDLIAYGLVREAEIMLYRDDAVATVELAERAQRLPGVRPRTLALAAQREAQGHALLGDRDRCRTALERAADRGSGAGDGNPVTQLGSTSVADLDAVVGGWCAYDLGRPDESVDLLTRGLASVPGTTSRMWALFSSRLALAHEAAGNLDEAERLAHHVAELAPVLDSSTVRSQLHLLNRALVRWHRHAPAQRLRTALADALHRPRS